MMDYGLLKEHGVFTDWNFVFLFLALIGIWLYLKRTKGIISNRKRTYFTLGIAIMYLALGSPLNMLGHHFLFSAHMLQQSLMFFIVPPFLLTGLPETWFRPWLDKPLPHRIARAVTNPIFSAILFNGLLSFYHYPSVFNFSMSTETIGLGVHAIIFLSSLFMWWNVVCPVSNWQRMTELKQLAFLFMNAILLYPACALMILTSKLLYAHYFDVPQVISFLPPLEDQRFGGVIMKLMQEGIVGLFVIRLLHRWYRKENPKEDDLDLKQGVRYE